MPAGIRYAEGMGEGREGTSIHGDLDRAVEYLKSIGCTEIYVFGSAARGDAREDSDLDIAVRGIPADKFFTFYGELMTRLSRPVDLIDLDLQRRFGEQLVACADLRRVS